MSDKPAENSMRTVAYLETDPLAFDIFRLVTTQIGVTGWQIARELRKPIREVEPKLSDLVSHGVVRANGEGRGAYYSPSSLGFFLRERAAI